MFAHMKNSYGAQYAVRNTNYGIAPTKQITIRGEIRQVENGTWPRDDNPLKNVPHTAASLQADDWQHPYSREAAAYPVAGLRGGKYWPPVGRVDNVYGDRNLFCCCVPVEVTE